MRSKRIITLLLVLSFTLTLLSSCSETESNNVEQPDNTVVSDSKDDTNDALYDVGYKLEKPSEDMQKKFAEEYRIYRNYEYDYPIVAIEYWLGSFGDIGFLFVLDGGLLYTDRVWTDMVADYSFKYGSSQSIKVWVDKKFLSLREAYNQKLIDDEKVAKIAEVYAQKQYVKVYESPTSTDVNKEYKLEKPAEDMQKKFAKEYIAFQNYDTNNAPVVAMEYWLGSFGDIGFLFVYDSEVRFTAPTQSKIIAGIKFDYPYTQSIMVWTDKKILTLDEAYRQKLITKDMVVKIAEVYQQNQYIAVYEYSTLDPNHTEFKLEMPTQAVREKFEKEYLATAARDSDGTVAIEYWLGSFGDVGFVWAYEEGVAYPAVYRTDVVADSSFRYSDGHTILVWASEQFLTIKEAYEQNLITKDAVAKLADVWAHKQYIKVIQY